MLDIRRLISDLGADVTGIKMDEAGGINDLAAKYIEKLGILPASKRKRQALTLAILTASRVAQQQFGPLGPVANFASGVGNDVLRELIRRILEVQPASTDAQFTPRVRRAPASPVIVGSLNEFTGFLFPWMKGRMKT